MGQKKKKFTIAVQTRYEPDVIERMDKIIREQKFDDRSQFIRMALNEFIQRREKTINA